MSAACPDGFAPFPPHVFVYGTLRPGERNAALTTRFGSPTVQRAILPAFQLFNLAPEGYPAIVPGTAGQSVRGEVLSYSPDVWRQLLPLLDALEGVEQTPPLYHRERVRVTLALGGAAEVWTYVYARAARLEQSGAVLVSSGDWLQRP
ncbi:gamma-glutamylcyclotransferase family protein [Deinococcus murrayi]|uniref:gamma-glutamylcyclotransferase family protein n=1 Tax=Deinococcus murrayi TaxID=68910 RepID=UPI0004894CAD|nr:gamma-glutamylcyclotransferase family protein [Deinococcus murrayi]